MDQDPRVKNLFFKEDRISKYLKEYVGNIAYTLCNIDDAQLLQASYALEDSEFMGGRIFVGGNGGSSSISDHLVCDLVKGTHVEDKKQLKVHCLNNSTALFTAISNDYGYEFTFEFQLKTMDLKDSDIVILISSSGNSPNIIKAAEYAISRQATVIGMTGFDGGKLKELADIKLHVPFKNYGIVEDSHQILMHVLAQWHFLKKVEK